MPARVTGCGAERRRTMPRATREGQLEWRAASEFWPTKVTLAGF
jgi:hypothetical protein